MKIVPWNWIHFLNFIKTNFVLIELKIFGSNNFLTQFFRSLFHSDLEMKRNSFIMCLKSLYSIESVPKLCPKRRTNCVSKKVWENHLNIWKLIIEKFCSFILNNNNLRLKYLIHFRICFDLLLLWIGKLVKQLLP